MRDHYHEDLEAIEGLLAELAARAAVAIDRSTEALLTTNLPLAEEVISGDIEMDMLTAQAETIALDLMATQQPVARDLRTLVASLRIVADLERMGDLAVHVAKVARLRYPNPALPEPLHTVIEEMGRVAAEIAEKCALVLASADPVVAAQLEADDDAMDRLHRQLLATLLSPGWPGGVEAAVDSALVGRYYERFADHAVSASQRMMYVITGQRPRGELAQRGPVRLS